jgi:hypothetical protein
VIGNKFAVCGLLVAIVASMLVAGACGGGQDSSAEEQDQKARLIATDPFELDPGLAIVEMTHHGAGDFVVDLLPTRQGETATPPKPIEFSGDQNGGDGTEAAFALADKTGPVNISRAVNISTGGEHVLDVKADGDWTVKVEQPRPSSAPRTSSFSGKGDTVTSFFRLSNGPKRITLTNPSQSDLKVSLLDKDGNAVEPAFVNETGQAGVGPRANVSSTLNVDEDGIYLFDVRTDGLWTIEVADVEEPVDVEQANATELDANPAIGPSVLLILLINLVWLLVFTVAIRLRGARRKRFK